MKILEMPGPEDEAECDATVIVDFKEGNEAFLLAFDKQLKEFGMEVVQWNTGSSVSVWKIQKIA